MQPSVLIVEDDSDIAGLIEFNVAREGYRTQVTHSGVVAMGPECRICMQIFTSGSAA